MMVYALGGFPQGKYIGGEVSPKPYLRVEGDFNVKTIHLSVSCGPERAKWDAWFDLVEATQKDTYKLKGYVTDPKYEKLLTFLTDNCGRAQGQSGDLATFLIHLSVACGPQRANWDAWFDLVNAGAPSMFRLKDYETDPKYKKYLNFFTQNCGRGRGYDGDLTVFIVAAAWISVTVNHKAIILYESSNQVQ
ncbi:hypothetical protein FOL47_000455 [Perkinsus chesapeaki]|uniref:Uncharacterized protein n=1 Tax=Perkinsus chesapeaki TaxID=330153 RepID=A0A7J6KWR4_PERCH|nr:hypothetical protein FOL47_000455 [Perkinsus chesapeaki]